MYPKAYRLIGGKHRDKNKKKYKKGDIKVCLTPLDEIPKTFLDSWEEIEVTESMLPEGFSLPKKEKEVIIEEKTTSFEVDKESTIPLIGNKNNNFKVINDPAISKEKEEVFKEISKQVTDRLKKDTYELEGIGRGWYEVINKRTNEKASMKKFRKEEGLEFIKTMTDNE